MISVYMGRWDLFAAGVFFGIPSTMLFHDMSKSGKGRMIELIKKLL